MADFLALRDHIPHLHSGDAARHLRHADVNDGYFADVFVVCIDHHDLAGSHCAEEGLTPIGRGLIVGDELRLVEVVGAWDLIDVLDDSIDGGVPTVVEEGTQEGLIDRPSLEQVGVVTLLELGCGEHVAQGVDVVLQPKVVGPLYVLLRLHGEHQRNGLAGVDDDIVGMDPVGRAFPNGSERRLEFSEEPRIPVLEAVVGQFGEADVLMVFYLLPRLAAEPAVGLFLIHEFQR